ncbi:MAG: hypothetical protein WAV41_02380 [Microgenomates group bacterium]
MDTVLKYYVRLMMLVLPISFLPIVVDSFGFGKNWILMTSALLGLLIWGGNLISGREEKVKVNKMWWLMGALVLWTWIQWWWKMEAGVKMRSVTDFGGVGTLSAWWLWLFIWLQTETDRKQQLNWLTAAGIVSGMLAITVFLWPSSKLPIIWPKNNPVFNITSNWSITGSLYNEIILIIFLVVEWGKRLYRKLKNEDNYWWEAGVAAFLLLVAMVDVFRLTKTGGMALLDWQTSWVIMVESFKRVPLWGVGSGNFVEAFFAYRPASYNLTPFWANWFKFSSVGLLHFWTEMGLGGLGIGILMASNVAKQKKDFRGVWLILAGLAVVILPYHFMGVWLLFWLVAGMENREIKTSLTIYVEKQSLDMGKILIMGMVMLIGLGGGYGMYKIVRGEYLVRQSILEPNIDWQLKAIEQLPKMADYHKSISGTYLTMAGAVLANKELTNDDKQKASGLIQQSVNEAKAAISLDKNNPTYWLNLAVIYRQLIGVVDGAADWTFQAYEQAVMMEPVNATSRLELGGLVYASGRYDEADRVFEAVLLNKNNYANGWYNWAHSAKQLGKLTEAVARLQQAITLVPIDSGDYEIASKELATWVKELDEANKKAAVRQEEQKKVAETLETSKPLPTGNAKSVVANPNGELNPPAAVVSPEPSAVPTKIITN